jgi:hypothetical protein
VAYCGTYDISFFTDPELDSATKVRAVHLQELRKALQEFHLSESGGHGNHRIIWYTNDSACTTSNQIVAGHSGVVYTGQDFGVIPNITTVKANHLMQMRDILDNYARKQNFEPFNWTPTIQGGKTKISWRHIEELRAALSMSNYVPNKSMPNV